MSTVLDLVGARPAPVESTVIELTPEVASRLLAGVEGSGQRSVSPKTVTRYAEDMSAGRWELNGQPVIVSSTGKLIDGQHRCRAVVQSGVTVPALLVVNVADSSIATIDTGKVRSGRDVLTMAGMKPRSAEIAASATRNELSFRRYTTPVTPSGRAGLTNARIAEFVEAEPRMRDATAWAVALPRQGGVIPPSMLAWVHYRTTEIEPASVQWLDALATGASLDSDDPRLWLRSRILASGAGRRFARDVVLAWCCKAWTRWANGKAYGKSNAFHGGVDRAAEFRRFARLTDESVGFAREGA